MVEKIGTALAQLDEYIPDLDGGAVLRTMLGSDEFRGKGFGKETLKAQEEMPKPLPDTSDEVN